MQTADECPAVTVPGNAARAQTPAFHRQSPLLASRATVGL